MSAWFYLVATLSYGGGELAHHHVYALQRGFLQLLDLLFHYSLKGQVTGEQACPAETQPSRVSQREGGSERGREGGGKRGQGERERDEGEEGEKIEK